MRADKQGGTLQTASVAVTEGSATKRNTADAHMTPAGLHVRVIGWHGSSERSQGIKRVQILLDAIHLLSQSSAEDLRCQLKDLADLDRVHLESVKLSQTFPGLHVLKDKE